MMSRRVALWIVLLVVVCALGQWLVGPTWPFGKLTVRTLRPALPMGEDSALSPDGKTIAVVDNVWKKSGYDTEDGIRTITVRDTQSSKVIGTLSIPTARTGGLHSQSWENGYDIQYCDRGKYMLLSDI